MTKKPNPLEQHKEKDIVFLRKIHLKIIEHTSEITCPHCRKKFPTPYTGQGDVKNKIESSKLIARLHQALQVDKTIINASALAGTFTKQELAKPELKPEHKEKLANLLDAQPS